MDNRTEPGMKSLQKILGRELIPGNDKNPTEEK